MQGAKLRTSAAALVMGCLVAGCETFVLEPPAQAEIDADSENVTDPSEIVVLVETRRAATELSSLALAEGYELVRMDALGGLGLIQLVLTQPAGRTGATAIAELEQLVPGATAGVNHAYRLQDGAAPRHYLKDFVSWPETGCRYRQPIGILDGSGPALPAGTRYRSFVPERSDAPAHGAEIAALLHFMAHADVHHVFVADVVGTTVEGEPAAGVDSLLRGISWLLESEVRIINISLAGPYNKILDRGFQRAADRGALMFAAAGNAGPTSPPRYPAALSDVVAVTGVDVSATLYDKAVRGPHIDVAAPGVDLFIDYGPGVYRSGTSYASPIVAAYFAVRGNGVMTAEGIRQHLAETATDVGAPGRDPLYGEGLLQADFSC